MIPFYIGDLISMSGGWGVLEPIYLEYETQLYKDG